MALLGFEDSLKGLPLEPTASSLSITSSSSSISHPPSFEKKGKYITSSSKFAEVSKPELQLMILGENYGLMEIQGLGQESLELWKLHFAPSEGSKKVIQMPADWVNFMIMALLSPERFDWAKCFISSQMWDIIIQGAKKSHLIPFVIPDSCETVYAPICKLKTCSSENN